MTSRHLIYGLIDPRDGQLRYVGKSASGVRRPKTHAYPAYLRRARNRTANWVKSLKAAGLMYDVEVLEECASMKEAAQAEQFWIANFRFLGCRLTNMTTGGDGGLPGLRHTPETKRKMSEAAGGAATKRDEAVRLYLTGMSTRKVAAALDIGNVTVFKYVKAAGVLRDRTGAHAVKGDRVLSAEENVRIVELYQSGVSGEEIKALLGITNNKAVPRALRNAGISMRDRSIAMKVAWANGRKKRAA